MRSRPRPFFFRAIAGSLLSREARRQPPPPPLVPLPPVTPAMARPHVAVIGAGPSGVFASIIAATALPTCDITLVEATKAPLGKLSLLPNLRAGPASVAQKSGISTPSELLSSYPRGGQALCELLSGPFGWTGEDVSTWFRREGVRLSSAADGGMFPASGDPKSMSDALRRAALRAGIRIRMSANVSSIDVLRIPPTESESPSSTSSTSPSCALPLFRVSYSQTRTTWGGGLYENMKNKRPRKVRTSGHFDCDVVMLATGGSTSGMSLAQSLGHDVVRTIPSLFSFRLEAGNNDKKRRQMNSTEGATDNPFHNLQGIHFDDVIISFAGKSARGPMHTTQSGVAGPVVLHLSSLAAKDMAACGHRGDLHVNLMPHFQFDEVRRALREHAKASGPAAVLTGMRKTKVPFPPLFKGHMSRKLWRSLVVRTAAAPKVDAQKILWTDLTEAHEVSLARALTGGLVLPLNGYDESSHEAGGVDLSQVNPMTMESLTQPGLFFGGSVLNMDGVSRSHNFQVSWSTGYAAGKGMAMRLTGSGMQFD